MKVLREEKCMRHFLAILLLLPCIGATAMEGKVYGADKLFPISGVVLKAAGPINVQMVLEEGEYSMELPPGEYEIGAYYYDEASLKYCFKERVAVSGERMQYDLVLFPPSEVEEIVPYNIGEGSENGFADDSAMQVIAGTIILLFFLFGFVLYYFIFNKKTDEAVTGMKELGRPAEPRGELDSEEKGVLKILKTSEGMSTQKELQRIMKCTDTKINLLVSSLEARGLVKRIKKGREKIVKLI